MGTHQPRCPSTLLLTHHHIIIITCVHTHPHTHKHKHTSKVKHNQPHCHVITVSEKLAQTFNNIVNEPWRYTDFKYIHFNIQCELGNSAKSSYKELLFFVDSGPCGQVGLSTPSLCPKDLGLTLILDIIWYCPGFTPTALCSMMLLMWC